MSHDLLAFPAEIEAEVPRDAHGDERLHARKIWLGHMDRPGKNRPGISE